MKIILCLMVLSIQVHNIQAIDLRTYAKSDKTIAVEKVYNVYKVDKNLLNTIYDLTQSVYGREATQDAFYLICSLIKIESDYTLNAKSNKNAYGLCQIRTINQKDINVRYGLSLDRYNTTDNILLGLLNLYFWTEHFGGLEKAIKFYNAGSDLEKGAGYYKVINKQIKKIKEQTS